MANKIYINPETAIVWTNTGGDEVLDITSLASNAVRVGSYLDRGASARSAWYMWELVIDGFATAPSIGEKVDPYLTEGMNSLTFTGPETPADAADGAGDVNRLPNLRFLKAATVWSTSTTNDLVVSGTVFVPSRYIAPVIHNRVADTLSGGKFTLVPIPDEIQ